MIMDLRMRTSHHASRVNAGIARRVLIASLILVVAQNSSLVLAKHSSSIAAYTWWQTSCEKYHAEPNAVVAVLLREFPITDTTVSDSRRTRHITFEPGGLGVRLGEQRLAVKANDVLKVSVRPLGQSYSAIEITITTKAGILTDGPLGVVELSCWREIEKALKYYRRTNVDGSPRIPNIPLRDANGNVIDEPKN